MCGFSIVPKPTDKHLDEGVDWKPGRIDEQSVATLQVSLARAARTHIRLCPAKESSCAEIPAEQQFTEYRLNLAERVGNGACET